VYGGLISFVRYGFRWTRFAVILRISNIPIKSRLVCLLCFCFFVVFFVFVFLIVVGVISIDTFKFYKSQNINVIIICSHPPLIFKQYF